MKQVFEYRLHMTKRGVDHPDWIIDGGYFWDGQTYVAVIESNRNYYVPDTLIELSKRDLLDRLIRIQHDESITEQQVGADSQPLTDDELSDFVDTWWSHKVDS
jgi:hypothetical protein